MIVVLCNSFDEAKEGFSRFMDFLEIYEPLSIFMVFEHSYCVETDDSLRYIFVDYRFRNLFHSFDWNDFVEMDEFFEGIDEFYFGPQEV